MLQTIATRFSLLWLLLSQFGRALGRRVIGRGRAGRTVLQEALVGILRQNGLRLVALPPAQARARIELMATRCSVRKLLVRERVSVGELAGEWFRPKTAPADAALLYLHGGGYVLGSIASYQDLIGRLAVACNVAVLAIDYRLAPEHPCPAAVDDGAAALAWLRQQGIAPARTFVAGDSSGGALAVAAMIAARDRGEPLPRAACLLSPWVDLAAAGGTITSNAANDWGDGAYLDHWARLYLGEAPARDPRASPLHAELRGLPPMIVQVGGDELLRDQVSDFAARAERAGCKVDLEVFPGMVHAWHMLAIAFPEADEAMAKLAAFVRAQLAA